MAKASKASSYSLVRRSQACIFLALATVGTSRSESICAPPRVWATDNTEEGWVQENCGGRNAFLHGWGKGRALPRSTHQKFTACGLADSQFRHHGVRAGF